MAIQPMVLSIVEIFDLRVVSGNLAKRVLASSPLVPRMDVKAVAVATVRPEAIINAITKIHVESVRQDSVPPATHNSAPNGLRGICSPVSATARPTHSEPYLRAVRTIATENAISGTIEEEAPPSFGVGFFVVTNSPNRLQWPFRNRSRSTAAAVRPSGTAVRSTVASAVRRMLGVIQPRHDFGLQR